MEMIMECERTSSDELTGENNPTMCFGGIGRLAVLVVLLVQLWATSAKALQPSNTSELAGTWVNANSSGVVAQVIITGGFGSFAVHPFGFCTPTLCDWGVQSALRFSDSISSSIAIGFESTM